MRILALPLLLIATACSAVDFQPVVNVVDDSATVSWVPPTTRVDDSPLPPDEIASYYVIGYGLSTDQAPIEVTVPAPATSHTIEGLSPGLNEFAVRTVDTNGLSADWSDVVTKVIKPNIPPAPVSGPLAE
jgi:hypothetical protein